MDIQRYYTEDHSGITFTETASSDFAKGVAGDFNPLHDPGNKRFCVPGDLLFSILLHRFGASVNTCVQFTGMLDGKSALLIPEEPTDAMHLKDTNGRDVLSVLLKGERFTNRGFIAQLTENYVQFSGKTFPSVLVPLMEKEGVMINPSRPMVIYKDMTIEFHDAARDLFENDGNGELDQWREPPVSSIILEMTQASLSVNGKKGAVSLQFSFSLNGLELGIGQKSMILSGLRNYDAEAMNVIVSQYRSWQQNYSGMMTNT